MVKPRRGRGTVVEMLWRPETLVGRRRGSVAGERRRWRGAPELRRTARMWTMTVTVTLTLRPGWRSDQRGRVIAWATGQIVAGVGFGEDVLVAADLGLGVVGFLAAAEGLRAHLGTHLTVTTHGALRVDDVLVAARHARSWFKAHVVCEIERRQRTVCIGRQMDRRRDGRREEERETDSWTGQVTNEAYRRKAFFKQTEQPLSSSSTWL